MRRRTFLLAAALLGAATIALAAAAEHTAPIPEFSGRFGRNAFNFEPVTNAPQPVMNLSRLPDGTSNIGQLVGDFHNPILKPETAEIVRVAAEPAGPPVHDVVVKSVQRFDVGWEKATKQTDDDYFRDNPGVKPYGLSNAPIAYTPAVTSQSPLQFEQQAKPERRDLARCWRQKEPARKLVAVGDRPVMVLEAEASFYAGYNHCNVEYLRQAGVPVTFIKLADLGIRGNGHMMMMEKNSDAIAQVIADWLDKAVTPLEPKQPQK